MVSMKEMKLSASINWSLNFIENNSLYGSRLIIPGNKSIHNFIQSSNFHALLFYPRAGIDINLFFTDTHDA